MMCDKLSEVGESYDKSLTSYQKGENVHVQVTSVSLAFIPTGRELHLIEYFLEMLSLRNTCYKCIIRE